ncbi:hypothetical protein ASD81_02805 [Nocardioides sp. Root614]|nr:hypothetical protein ASD81_02805 [Nocardioides sp. Root614]KRA91609.1 hypothetical protein ASD84_03070 [Nocardioides sp. Root682]
MSLTSANVLGKNRRMARTRALDDPPGRDDPAPRNQQWTWGRGQAMAAAGLLVIVLVGVGGSLGSALADAVGAPVVLGGLLGTVAGYYASRAMLRAVVPRLMP